MQASPSTVVKGGENNSGTPGYKQRRYEYRRRGNHSNEVGADVAIVHARSALRAKVVLTHRQFVQGSRRPLKMLARVLVLQSHAMKAMSYRPAPDTIRKASKTSVTFPGIVREKKAQ